VIFFFVAAFAITWSALLPLLVLPREIAAATPWLFPLLVAGKYGPTLAGLLAANLESGAAGVEDLVRRLLPRPGDAKWILGAVLAPFALDVAATALVVRWGGAVGPLEPRGLLTFGPLLAQKLALGGGLGEELGWRGFALPRLQARMHPLAASLLLGVIGAAWRWPAFRAETSGPFADSLWLFAAAALPASIVFTCAYNFTGGSLIACALLHASIPASTGTLERTVPLLWLNGVADVPAMAVWAWVAVLLIGFTRGRLGFAQPG
jgi:membrane protease YdiL (CAAX protease family)